MKKEFRHKAHPVKVDVQKVKVDKTTNYLIYGIIFALTFGLYGNTLFNGYALDDAIVITQNEFTKKGIDGIKDVLTTEGFTGFFGTKKNLVAGGRYRPLSLVTFAVEYSMFKESPGVSHFINIVLYACTGILIYLILKKLLEKFKTGKWYFSLPFVATLLYIAHPIHTEVVANIKGRDEIMSFLGSLLALHMSLKYLDSRKAKYLIYSFIWFFLGLMSKENTITFLVVIPLSVYFFTNHENRRIMLTLIPMGVATLLYLVIRQSILGTITAHIPKELMNNPFLNTTIAQKFATIVFTLWLYIKLLVFPHPLTFDYYPYHIPIIGWGDYRAFLPFILYIVLIIIAIRGFRQKDYFSYCILFYLVTLSIASNIVLPVGTFMNERFVYVSSLGFSLVIAYLFTVSLPELIRNSGTFRPVFAVLLIVVLALYSVKTIARNPVWKNDFTLFSHDVKISGNSAKSTCSAGGKLIEEAQKLKAESEKNPSLKPQNEKLYEEYLKSSIQYLHKSIKIHPTYVNALLLMGNAFYEYNKNYDSTLYYYKQILKIDPNNNLVYGNISKIFSNYDNPGYKIRAYEDINRINPNVYEVNYALGSLYGRYFNNIPAAIHYLEKAVSIKPTAEVYKDLGAAYGFAKQYEKSIKMSENALAMDPGDADVLINIGTNYRELGNMAKANEYFRRAEQINPKLRERGK
jgi:Tfp pilus assembly protein PilF